MISLHKISEAYLRSFNLKEQEPQESAVASKRRKKLKSKKMVIQGLDDRTQSEIVLTKIFSESTALKDDLNVEEPVVESGCWDDLNLIYGNTSTPNQTLLNRINKTTTVVGSCTMATELVNPKRTVEQIQNTQEVTKQLLQNSTLTEELGRNLESVKNEEEMRLSLWQDENNLTNREYAKELNSFYFKRFGLHRYNRSVWMLQLAKIWKDIWGHWVLWGFILVGLLGAGLNMFCSVLGYKLWSWSYFFYNCYLYCWIDIVIPFSSFFLGLHFWIWNPFEKSSFEMLKETLYSAKEGNKEVDGAFILGVFLFSVPGLIGMMFLYMYYKRSRKHSETLNFLAGHLASVQSFLQGAKNISNLVQKHPELEKLYGKQLVHTRALLKEAKRSTEVGRLIYNLQICSLRKRYYFFSNTGRLLVVYKLFQANRICFANAMYELGKVDTLLSTVRLLQGNEAYHSVNRYGFSEVTEKMPNGIPAIIAEQMWNPFLDAHVAIWNDLKMEDQQLIIITGPNAGGKSCYAIGVGVAIVLSQVYGIVPAAYCKHTLFAKLLTYVNPTQNLSAGLSLSEAGMEVLKHQMNILKRMPKAPMLAIMDEILSGMDPKLAEDISFKVLQARYDQYPNLTQLLTTHYRKLTTLAKSNPKVMNKRVDLIVPGKEGREYDYTYKVVDGISPKAHNVALQMVEEKGIL